MKYIVCAKQVPGTTNVKIDPATGNLMRDGASAKLNPYDLYGIELALCMRESTGGEVTALCMGPPQAAEALREVICMGADRGVLISDRAFAGSDVLATASALRDAVGECGEYDVIICGKQTTDGDTAQVGAELSELLAIPMASSVTEVVSNGNGRLTVKCETEDEICEISLPTPCLICVGGNINTPRLPSYKRKKALSDSDVRVLSVSDLSSPSPEKYGSSGSPTRVERIFPPEGGGQRQTLCGSGAECAEGIADILKNAKFI